MLSVLKGIDSRFTRPLSIAICCRTFRRPLQVSTFAAFRNVVKRYKSQVLTVESLQVKVEALSRGERNKEVAQLTKQLVKGNTTAYRSLQIYTSKFRCVLTHGLTLLHVIYRFELAVERAVERTCKSSVPEIQEYYISWHLSPVSTYHHSTPAGQARSQQQSSKSTLPR